MDIKLVWFFVPADSPIKTDSKILSQLPPNKTPQADDLVGYSGFDRVSNHSPHVSLLPDFSDIFFLPFFLSHNDDDDDDDDDVKISELTKRERRREGETEIVYGVSAFIGATAYWHYSDSQGKDSGTRVKQGIRRRHDDDDDDDDYDNDDKGVRVGILWENYPFCHIQEHDIVNRMISP
uniref:Uncharacterized protein n=1 Tax=Vespula pensylvanica TaxID=30213 RepID=A0A834UCY0_VESPE|nr:hypothetical protein H0235_004673 [Vespula pensylvanica]